MAVLMGANSRTYKFALGVALLELAAAGHETVSMSELAAPYALRLAERAARFPQAPPGSVGGGTDFLAVLQSEGPATRAAGQPSERLVAAAADSMPGMVMQKFHNLRSVGTVDHTFYEIRGKGASRRVVLRDELRRVARHTLLSDELSARWSIVEACFDAQIGRGLVAGGVVLSPDGQEIVTAARRVPLTRARSGLSGFQHGRCFYCHNLLPADARGVHVDHVYPFMLMKSGRWHGPDLNGVWNLVLACAGCNLRKSARLPQVDEVTRLIERNNAIAGSPHPLRRTLELTMTTLKSRPATTPAARLAFLQRLDVLVTDRGLN